MTDLLALLNKNGILGGDMGGSQAVVTLGSELGLPCPGGGLIIQLGVDLTP